MIDRKYSVLITPAGSGMAVAAIKSLKRDSKIRVISADVNQLAPGLFLSDRGYTIPSFTSEKFYETIIHIIREEKIDVIIPALDTILFDFSNKKGYFEEYNVNVLVSEPKTIEITRDKWKTYNEFKNVIPLPKSSIDIENIDIDFPMFIKPRAGSGSKFAYKINSQEELNFFYNRINEPIIQEYLEGKEYTVDCLADKNGKLLVNIPRERIEVKAGITVKGRIVENDDLRDMAHKITKKLKFCGPFFFQAKEDSNGVPKLTEINARISGTMSLSTAAGINIHSLAVRLFMGEEIKIPNVRYGVYISRYWEDIYLNEDEIKTMLRGK